MLPPSFIDFVITRGHADGVLLAGCADGDCHYRLGIKWTEARVAGTRDPYLRGRVPRDRLAMTWTGSTGDRRLQRELGDFQRRLEGLPPFTRPPRRSAGLSAGEGTGPHV